MVVVHNTYLEDGPWSMAILKQDVVKGLEEIWAQAIRDLNCRSADLVKEWPTGTRSVNTYKMQQHRQILLWMSGRCCLTNNNLEMQYCYFLIIVYLKSIYCPGLVEMGIHGISKGLGVWQDNATLWSSIVLGIRNMSSHQDVRVVLRMIEITMEHNRTASWSVVLIHLPIVRKTIHIRLIGLLQNYKLKATGIYDAPTVCICISAPFSLNLASTLQFITACLHLIYLGNTWLSRILVSVFKHGKAQIQFMSTYQFHLFKRSSSSSFSSGNPRNPIYFHEAVESLLKH